MGGTLRDTAAAQHKGEDSKHVLSLGCTAATLTTMLFKGHRTHPRPNPLILGSTFGGRLRLIKVSHLSANGQKPIS